MPDENKTRDELIIELNELRERISKSSRLENERKKAEEALKESRQMLQLVMDSIPQAIFWKDTNSVFLGCNKVLARDVGLTEPKDIIGKKDFDLPMTREQSESYRDYDHRVMAMDTPIYHILEEQRRPDDTVAWLDTNKIPLHDSDGNVMGVLCTYEDITERKKAEEALRRSENRFKQLIESSPMPMALYDQNENVEYLNEKFVKAFGYTLKDVPNVKYWWKLAYTDEAYRAEIFDKWHRMVEEAIVEDAETMPIENTVTCKDGSVRIMEAIGSSIGDKILVTFNDITKRKLAEEEVKHAYAYNRNMIETSLDPLVTIAPDGKITDVNIATESVTGYPREKLIGTDFSDYFTDPEKAKEGYLKVLHKGSLKDYPLEIRHRYGHITPVIYNAAIYRDDHGEVIGIFAAARDVTERKQVEEALEEAKNQAEIYLDLMGHDINNLNQVGMGYLELAMDTLNLDQKGKELIAKPLEALENSSKLIDKVRKIQQIKTGEPKLYEIDVARSLRDLIPKYRNINGRDVTINYVSGCHCFVMANELLDDVFSNILGNAIKHSGGPLTINVRVSKAEAVDRAYCKVTIEDNGTGIPDNMKKKLFSRFQRGDTKASGKGLGLYLVRSLVHCYHGYVWIEDSVPGDHTKGARFVVMLPVIEDASLYEKFNNTKST